MKHRTAKSVKNVLGNICRQKIQDWGAGIWARVNKKKVYYTDAFKSWACLQAAHSQ